jgi:hypothetical protein
MSFTGQHRAGLAKWEEALRRAEADEVGGLTPQLREAAAKFLTVRKQHHTLIAVSSSMAEIQRLMAAPAGAVGSEPRLSRINKLFDALVDDLLDVPEPYRTRLFANLMPLREQIKAMERDS